MAWNCWWIITKSQCIIMKVCHTMRRNTWALDSFKDPGFNFLIYTVTLICSIIISPVNCEFQNLLLPCSWFHLMMPTSNQLPKTSPWSSFSIAVKCGDGASSLTLPAACPMLARNSIIQGEVSLNASLPCTSMW